MRSLPVVQAKEMAESRRLRPARPLSPQAGRLHRAAGALPDAEDLHLGAAAERTALGRRQVGVVVLQAGVLGVLDAVGGEDHRRRQAGATDALRLVVEE